MKHLDLKNKKVLVRVDFNVPLNDTYAITDDTRIIKALPTIKYVLSQGAKVILMSHLGRPQKKLNEDGSINREKFTLKHLVSKLSKELPTKVHFIDDHRGAKVKEAISEMAFGEVLLLENTRFSVGESKGDVALAQDIAQLGDVYINDAFGTAHRAHASTAVIAQFFNKSSKAFGMLMTEEIENAEKLLLNPESPVTAIIGGAKVSDKIQLIDKLILLADNILIGGGMAYTFIKAQGGQIGKSLCEDDYLQTAMDALKKAKENNTKIYLPADSLAADGFSADTNFDEVASDKISEERMGLDIGSKAITEYKEVIKSSKTILWNGPMGVFEFENFSKGTFSVAEAVADATEAGAFSLIGGGDSVSAINKSGLSNKVSFISTGGGAMLEFLEGKELPGIKAIRK